MNSKSKRLRKGPSYLGILIAFLVLCAVLAIFSDSFLTLNNFLNVSQQISTNFLIAMGMTFIILLGGIDLSVGSVVALTGMVLALLMKEAALPVPLSILLGLIFATAIGLITGLLITRFSLTAFIATLGMMSIGRGAAYVITGGQPVYSLPSGFLAITSRINGVPVFTILIMIVVLLVCAYVLKYTKYGRYIYAIGGNRTCAQLSGINVKRVECIAYAISGFCCGMAAIVLSARLDSAVPTNADGAEMDAIAAVVIGGTSMTGGEGNIAGTVIGVLIIGIISNGMNLLNVSQGVQRMAKGIIIILAVVIDVIRRRQASRSAA